MSFDVLYTESKDQEAGTSKCCCILWKNAPSTVSFKNEAKKNWCDRLGTHAGSIVVAGELSNVFRGTKFYHHGEGAVVNKGHSVAFDNPYN